MPLGGVLVGARVRAPFWDDDVPGAVFRHGYTYSGHAGAAAAAMANLDIIEREGLVARVASLEPVLDRAVRRLESAPGVGEIRTVGLTAAVAFSQPTPCRGPGAAGAGRRRGPSARRRDACPARPRAPDLAAVRDHRVRDRHDGRRLRGSPRGRGAAVGPVAQDAAVASDRIRPRSIEPRRRSDRSRSRPDPCHSGMSTGQPRLSFRAASR